jgi:DNA-binding beta-propeller fold protein YncE
MPKLNCAGLAIPLVATLLSLGMASRSGAAATPDPCGAVTDYRTLMAVDASGTIFVAPEVGTAVLRFAPGVSGNVAPSHPLCGAATEIDRIQVLAAFGNRLFVVNDGSVDVFPVSAVGNTAPSVQIGRAQPDNLTGLLNPVGGPIAVALSPDGTLLVLDNRSVHTQGLNDETEVYVFAPGASGDVKPERIFAPVKADDNGAWAIALDSKARLYFVDSKGGVMLSGPQMQPPNNRVAVVDTDQPRALALDGNGRLFVADGARVAIITGATSGAPRIAMLGGPHTGLRTVEQLATDAANHLYVLNCVDRQASILTFGANPAGDVSPIARIMGDLTTLHC